jgi:hypothetical protein
MITRRSFIHIVPAVGAGCLLLPAAQAADLDPKDAQATALGYVADATKADKAKFATYQAGQNCTACQLFLGKAGEATGPCALFGGKNVSAKGWCSGYAKKA